MLAQDTGKCTQLSCHGVPAWLILLFVCQANKFIHSFTIIIIVIWKIMMSQFSQLFKLLPRHLTLENTTEVLHLQKQNWFFKIHDGGRPIFIIIIIISNLAKGRTAELSPLAAENGFVRSLPLSNAWFISHCLTAAVGECTCSAHTEDECIRRSDGWPDGDACGLLANYN